MESFHGYESKFEYSMVGHSGDSPSIPFVDYANPPKNRRERFEILEKMAAHSQFCMSGDFTLEATEIAIAQMAKADADEKFVFVISDANLERYGIHPKELAKILVSDPSVQSYAIFIASMWHEGERIARSLPPGHGFVCERTSQLPITFKNIFTSHVVT